MATASGVLVTGDVVVDHQIYEGRRHHFNQPSGDGVHVHAALGGAALVADLLTHLLPGRSVFLRPSHDGPDASMLPVDSAYAFWRPFPRRAPRERQFWRVAESMGFGVRAGTATYAPFTPASAASDASVVVLADGGFGFRDSPDAWPTAALGGAKWIVLKLSAPAAEGALWEHLVSHHQERLVVVVAARELRQSSARVSAGLSWEDTLASLVAELQPDRALRALTRCRHLIVSFEAEGVAWFDLTSAPDGPAVNGPRVHVVVDAPVIEGERSHAIEGKAFGFQSCMTAAVAWQLAQDEADLEAALEGGLAAARDLLEKGHGPATETPSGFPASRLAHAIAQPPFVYSRLAFGAKPSVVQPGWSLLAEALGTERHAFDLASLVLLRGPIALASLPHLRIGKLLTAERLEMESLRTLTQVMRRYQSDDAGKKPLSLAVFGPPGAGKSFAVRELASHIMGAEAAWLEFNLSQFSTTDDLIGAFHQVRDQVLQGKLPVAFFDEFDAHSYRWLASLLAPMQDGRFQDRQLTHTIGKCIFVFAGGTSWTFDTFGPRAPSPGDQNESSAWREFRLAKGPDFKSRIDGYLNVVGPNRRMLAASPSGPEATTWVGGHGLAPDPGDIGYPIRRALMIRSELRCEPQNKLDMDEGLLRALLLVDAYTHGARSLAKIVQPFLVARERRVTRSLTLPDAQLGMHVDTKAFLALCNRATFSPATTQLTESQLERMAPAIHETWRELGRRGGWLEPENDKPFDQLTDFFKASNRAAA
jgi:hypothetical protein